MECERQDCVVALDQATRGNSMSRAERLLERMRQSPHGWGADDVEDVLRYLGLRKRNSGHAVYGHPDYPDLFFPVPRHERLASPYIRNLIKIADLVADRDLRQY